MSGLRLFPVVLALVLLSGCSHDSDDGAGPGPVADSPDTTATSTPAPTATSVGCAPTGDGVPQGAQFVTTIDLDGDGSADQLWIADQAETRTLGVTTASGATFTHPIDLAGPAGASAFALRPAEMSLVLLSDNRVADLLTVQNCALVEVTDAEGQPWSFDLGFAGNGTGVGCVDLTGDGQLDLVGLNVLDPGSDPETVERTEITLTGTVASAGTSDQVSVPATDTTAHAITCDDRTMDADGVHEAD